MQRRILRVVGMLMLSVLTLLIGACGQALPALPATSARTPTPTVTPPASPMAAPSTAWQRTVDRMAALTQGLEPPEHLLQEDATKTGREFDVNSYFQVLDRLSMEPGYVLDYVYRYDEAGGEPVLHARPANRPPYENYSAYLRAGEPPDAYLHHVQLDGTAAAFFQLVVLHIMGEQFYLWYHGNMHDTTIIADQAKLPDLFSTIEAFCGSVPPNLPHQAHALSFEPSIELQETTAVVHVVTFSKWGGFERTAYTIQRSFPHTMVQAQTEVLVPYHCEVVF
jgi:hypothetical protein